MKKVATRRLTPEDWVRGALRILQERGVSGVKVTVLAERLGVTSGSFYWHFKGLPDLHATLLEYWERELTDAIVDQAKAIKGVGPERILQLMTEIVEFEVASLDHAISVWARSDPKVRETYERTLQKRFDFAGWMFSGAGFPQPEAALRGRLMVAYLMGESSTNLKSRSDWRELIAKQHELLTSPIG